MPSCTKVLDHSFKDTSALVLVPVTRAVNIGDTTINASLIASLHDLIKNLALRLRRFDTEPPPKMRWSTPHTAIRRLLHDMAQQ